MKKYTAEFTNEALQQLDNLENISKRKILKAIKIFEEIGINYKNINDLNDGLFELKPDNVRAYFKYAKNKIIIIGFIIIKRTQKAPKRYIEQAHKNIEKYLQENKELKL